MTDTGIGLDSKLQAHLFERFYRNRERHQAHTYGFGIGLDLCMRLVELHDGTITGTNREDGVRGSVFTVTLPLLKDAPAEQRVQQIADGESDSINKEERLQFLVADAPEQPEEDRHRRGSVRSRVMVVDDDEELSAYLERNLGKRYYVNTYSSGEEAVRNLSDNLPDIIITDVRMKGMDGFELLKRVKSNVSTHHIPVILFSSVNEVLERTRGWRSGADGYIAKPFSIDEIDGMIRGLLSTRSKLRGKYSGV